MADFWKEAVPVSQLLASTVHQVQLFILSCCQETDGWVSSKLTMVSCLVLFFFWRGGNAYWLHQRYAL